MHMQCLMHDVHIVWWSLISPCLTEIQRPLVSLCINEWGETMCKSKQIINFWMVQLYKKGVEFWMHKCCFMIPQNLSDKSSLQCSLMYYGPWLRGSRSSTKWPSSLNLLQHPYIHARNSFPRFSVLSLAFIHIDLHCIWPCTRCGIGDPLRKQLDYSLHCSKQVCESDYHTLLQCSTTNYI